MPVISEQLKPIDTVNGFQIRPGFFREFGAVAIPGGVNFTIHTHGATSCELLLFHRKAEEPYAVIPFPESYRIGFCYSMIVFDLDIEEFEYAYRLDGPYDEKKGPYRKNSEFHAGRRRCGYRNATKPRRSSQENPSAAYCQDGIRSGLRRNTGATRRTDHDDTDSRSDKRER